MMKCRKCGKEKDQELFETAKYGYRKICKDCRKEYFKIHNSKRKDYLRERNRKAIKRNYILLREYTKEHPCVDCGETDPIVLEFDHVIGKKEFAISTLASKTSKWEKIEQELKKCVVRCANCHRRKTALDLGWHSYLTD